MTRLRPCLSLVAVAALALAFSGVASAAAGVGVVLEGTGTGSVTDASGAIDCPGDCSATSDTGSALVVALRAVSGAGSAFAGWQVSNPYLTPPWIPYGPLAPILAGCGSTPDCTVQVAWAPDFIWPGCDPRMYGDSCIGIGYATVRVTATFVPVDLPQPEPPQLLRSDATFLCYSRYPGSVPGVFTFETAGKLLKENPWTGPEMTTGGYSIPIAVTGTVDFGTNVGGYHLVCNPGTLAPQGTYTNASGDTIGAAEAASIRASWQSDLNLFPVYG